jgi:elongator complex protein 5
VPLPYAHEGQLSLLFLSASHVERDRKGKSIINVRGAIFYDPDSADDIDDDDPDEDLDI